MRFLLLVVAAALALPISLLQGRSNPSESVDNSGSGSSGSGTSGSSSGPSASSGTSGSGDGTLNGLPMVCVNGATTATKKACPLQAANATVVTVRYNKQVPLLGHHSVMFSIDAGAHCWLAELRGPVTSVKITAAEDIRAVEAKFEAKNCPNTNGWSTSDVSQADICNAYDGACTEFARIGPYHWIFPFHNCQTWAYHFAHTLNW